MTNERYLEYLALDSILQGYLYPSELTAGRPDKCEFYFADGTFAFINVNQLKERVAMLQKEFMEDYFYKEP
jgi:hypothetical protein